MSWLDHRIPPPIVGAIVAAGMWGISSIGQAFAIPSLARYVAIALLVATGIAFDVSGILGFRAARTTVNPLRPGQASTLVTGGVYRMTRNPMYVGLALLLSAWAVYLSALLPFAGIAVFVLYITRFQIRPEEQVLRQRFGDAYVDYSKRVRRWL